MVALQCEREVELAVAPMRVSMGTLLPDEVRPQIFEVICIRSGEANGLRYPAPVLSRSVEEGLWEGVAVFANHSGPRDFGRPGERRIEDVVGVLSDVRWAGESVVGLLRCHGPKAAMVAQLARSILEAQERGELTPNIGLSADIYVQRKAGEQEVTRIVRVNSVDVVYNPAAGGAFLRVLNIRGGTMEEPIVEAGKENGNGNGKEPQESPALEPVELEEEGVKLGLALQESHEVMAAQCSYLLETALRASELPQPLREELRQQFSRRVFRAEDLERAIQGKRDTWARLMEDRVVRGAGTRLSMRSELDRVRLAAERLFGLPLPEDATAIPRLSGLRELYLALTGDYDFHGRAYPERVQLANVTTSTMANVTADVLNKVMLRAYNRRERWWEPLVTHRDLERFQEMKMIRVSGFSALSTVSEGGAYSEKSWSDLQETANIVKKGNYVGITLEMIMADDVEAVRAIPQLLGTAAYNSVSDAVAGVFLAGGGVGPLMSDEENLFSAAHNNLGSAALDFDSFDAAQVAVMSQAEPGSSRRLGVPGRYLLVPVQLRSTGMVIRNSVNKPGGGENDVNPWYDDFEVVVVPSWTDGDDWALATDPAAAEHIVLGWLQGKREPEIFTATDETAGAMFSNDEMRIKVRFFICCGVADYRGLYKANVTA